MPDTFKILHEAFSENRSDDGKEGYRHFDSLSHLVSEPRMDQTHETGPGRSQTALMKDAAEAKKETPVPVSSSLSPSPSVGQAKPDKSVRENRSMPSADDLHTAGDAELWRKAPLRDVFSRLRLPAGQEETVSRRLQGVFRR